MNYEKFINQRKDSLGAKCNWQNARIRMKYPRSILASSNFLITLLFVYYSVIIGSGLFWWEASITAGYYNTLPGMSPSDLTFWCCVATISYPLQASTITSVVAISLTSRWERINLKRVIDKKRRERVLVNITKHGSSEGSARRQIAAAAIWRQFAVITATSCVTVNLMRSPAPRCMRQRIENIYLV